MVTTKVPRAPSGLLTREPEDLKELSAPVWRVHRTSGAHVLAWNELRSFGFLPTMRWDPHPAPGTEQHRFGVLYAAGDI